MTSLSVVPDPAAANLTDSVDVAVAVIFLLERERNLYRQALERIAGQESGGWGTIAAQALRQAKELSL